MVKHLNITVQGKVQGVFFRNGTKAVADQLGIRGSVRNTESGDVYIEAEAEPMLMDMFMEWCHKGPDAARVTEVKIEEGEVKNYRNFEVVRR